MSWSDGSTEIIFRRYSKFFDLQVSLLAMCCSEICRKYSVILWNTVNMLQIQWKTVFLCVVARASEQSVWKNCDFLASKCLYRSGTECLVQHCPPVHWVLGARLSVHHPYDTGNYTVWQEFENTNRVNTVQWWLQQPHSPPQKCLNHSWTSRRKSVLHKEGVSLVS